MIDGSCEEVERGSERDELLSREVVVGGVVEGVSEVEGGCEEGD